MTTPGGTCRTPECDTPVADASVCTTCTHRLTIALGDVPDLLTELDVDLTRQSRSGNRVGGRSPETPLPFDGDASITTRQVRRRFKASRLEFSFGLPLGERVDRDSIEQPIAIALANETLQLVGRIDRIDHDDEGNFVLYDYKLSTSRYSGCHDMEQTTNFQLPLYVLAYQQWLAEQGRPGKAVGAGFYGLRSQDGYKKVGLWEKSALDDLGLGKLRSGVTEDVAEEAKVVLPRIAEMLASVRSGRFYMLPEHEPNPYYGDEAVFRHDPVTLQQKARAVAERGNDDA